MSKGGELMQIPGGKQKEKTKFTEFLFKINLLGMSNRSNLRDHFTQFCDINYIKFFEIGDVLQVRLQLLRDHWQVSNPYSFF